MSTDDNASEKKMLMGNQGGKKCFIATAAYGSPIADEVMFLRRLRDDRLKQSRIGSLFVQVYEWIYYQFSPRVASIMDRNRRFKNFMKIMIVQPIVRFLRVISKSIHKIKRIIRN